MNVGLPVAASTMRGPGRMVPGQTAQYATHLASLTCRSFLGGVLSPVSANVVVEKYGISGANVYQLREVRADWPPGVTEDYPVMPKDLLVLPQGSYSVQAVIVMPSAYLRILVQVPLP